MEKGPSHPGSDAPTPTRMPPSGWWQALRRALKKTGTHDISSYAAGLAYYAMFALFPTIAALVAIWGIFLDPEILEAQLAGWLEALPPEAAGLLLDQLGEIAGARGGTLGVAAILGLLVALYSSSRGTMALIVALNHAYEERETRGFLKLNLAAIGLTLVILAFVLLAIALIALAPVAFAWLGLGAWGEAIIRFGRWPVLVALMMGFLATFYRYGPCRAKPRWEWATPGAILATLVWLGASVAFSIYVSNFADYNETYGALGAVMILLLWLFISGYAVLLGAEVNAELEHQTSIDSTDPPERPLGHRGAWAADDAPEV